MTHAGSTRIAIARAGRDGRCHPRVERPRENQAREAAGLAGRSSAVAQERRPRPGREREYDRASIAHRVDRHDDGPRRLRSPTANSSASLAGGRRRRAPSVDERVSAAHRRHRATNVIRTFASWSRSRDAAGTRSRRAEPASGRRSGAGIVLVPRAAGRSARRAEDRSDRDRELRRRRGPARGAAADDGRGPEAHDQDRRPRAHGGCHWVALTSRSLRSSALIARSTAAGPCETPMDGPRRNPNVHVNGKVR